MTFRLFLHPLSSYDRRVGVYLFDLRDSHPHHLRLCPTSIELDIRDFHSYFIILYLYRIFLIPDMALVVERLPSTQVPYDLRNTLGYFAA